MVEQKRRLFFYQLLLGVIFAFASMLCWSIFRNSATLFDKIFGIIVSIFLSSVSLVLFLKPLNGFPIFKHLYYTIQWILGLILLMAMGVQVVAGPFLVLVMIIGTQLVFWKIISYLGLAE